MGLDKINILQISARAGISERAFQIFSENLDRDVFSVYVATGKHGKEPDVRSDILKKKGLPVYEFNADYDGLSDFLIEKSIDIVHIHTTEPGQPHGVFEALRKTNISMVETNVFGYYDKNQANNNLIDRHLFISKDAAYGYMRRGGVKIEDFLRIGNVIYNPVPTDEFNANLPSKDEILKIKSKLGVEDNYLMLRVGRADIWKWNYYPVDVMNLLVRKLKNVRYVIVGGIPKLIEDYIKKKHLEKYFISLGQIVDQKKLIRIYHSIDVLAHMSRIGESFGTTIAEAMAARKPVIVNSTPWKDNAQIELVDNNITGFTKLTPKDYANAIYYLFKNKKTADEMGIAGYKKAKTHFDGKKLTRMVEKIYIDIIARKRRIPRNLINRYSKIKLIPTNRDIANYKNEYKRRLRTSYGDSNLFERFACMMKYAFPHGFHELPMYAKYFSRFIKLPKFVKT